MVRCVFGAACVGAALLLASPTPARAQARDASAVAAAAKARAAYERGDFREAVALYEKAYARENSATILFNLGRCHEALATEADLRIAVEKYEAYLAATERAPDREAVKRRIEALREQVRVLESARLATPAPAPPPRAQADPPPNDAAPSPWPWVLAGSGGVVLAAGAVFGVLALGAHDDAVASPSGAEAMDLEDTATTFATASTAMIIAGAALAVGGATWGSIDVVRAGGAQGRRVRVQAGASRVALRVDF